MSPPANNSGIHSMEGDFVVKDDTSTKGKKCKKCRVLLQSSTNDKAILQITESDVKSGLNEKVENKVFVPEHWLPLFAEDNSQTASLALVNSSALHETLVLEATFENRAVLKTMEKKLREILKVISYDITIGESAPGRKVSQGVIHIFRDKVLVTQGFPPDLQNILSHSLHACDKDWIKIVDTQGICLGSKPGVLLFSEHRDHIWKTLQGCLESVVSEGQNSSGQSSTIDQEMAMRHHPYQNIPLRPCRYIYMNLADQTTMPFDNHRYVNVFNLSGAIYQNWQSCKENAGNQDHNDEKNPPPCPPRRPPPRIPPRPRNRLPNSPLPPIPTVVHNSTNSPPPLPPRSEPNEPIRTKEVQFVMYCSKPVVGKFWVIQIIFLQKNDYRTLQRIKKMEEESNYQLLKPLPECVKFTGDSTISLLEIESGCTLKSDAEQTVEFQVVNEAVLESCWMVIEFHLEHNEHMKRNYHAKIVIQTNRKTKNMLTTKKEILISVNFQDQINGNLHPLTSVCNQLRDMDVRKYLELCNLLDMPCALRNDWTGLAGEVGLTIEQVFKIQSKAFFPNFSPTNEVLNIWSHKENKTCSVDELRNILNKLKRFDVLSVLVDT